MVALASYTSETSTWDVLDGFPKLHSRARELKTRTCTEALALKSLVRVEIWQVVYESCDGLESFTRDPIGYEGSDWNLYEYCGTMPLHMNDPSGNIYGNWCGALRSGPGAPIDDIDRACMNHDICLATWVEFVTPCRRRICDKILCWAVLTPPYSCIGSPNYLNCVTAATAIQALFCYGFGTAPLPYPW